MASNFAFRPMGLSQQVTVVAAAGTVTFSVINQGGTTASLSLGAYRPSGIRIVNSGTVGAFVAFGASAPTIAVGNGMEIPTAYVGVFNSLGTPAMAFVSAGTTTINVTPGEGMS